jgi:hypothetical protein
MICKKIQGFAESSRCSYRSSYSRQNDIIPPRRVIPTTSLLSRADFLREFRKYEKREVKVTLTGFKCRLCDTFRTSLKQSLDYHIENEHSCDKLLKPLNVNLQNGTSHGDVHHSEDLSDTSLLAVTSPVELNDVSLSVTSLANGRVDKNYDPVVISIQKLVQVRNRLQALK